MGQIVNVVDARRSGVFGLWFGLHRGQDKNGLVPSDRDRPAVRPVAQCDVRHPRSLTQRGRGRYSFWIHTLPPPPDFELSD